MLKVAKKSMEMGARKVILLASHATLTEEGTPFDEAFKK
jgi:hypothetical protein